MGKSYANFMCKKFFHPASYDNIKRVWMAQQRTDAEKSRQESLRSEYEREQETYVNRQLMGDEKVKHGLTFMYEPPKGFKSEEKDKDGEPEYKFEWQRVAPREGYAKNMDVTDQPFGIAVRKVKCIRCHNWGHVNTDRECPLFNNNKDESISGPSTDKSELLEDMRRDGYVLKQNVLDRKVDHGSKNQQIIPSDEEEVPETAFLKSLSTKDKKKLLKKLNEMEKPNDLRKRKKNKIRQHPSSDDNSDDFRGKEPERKKKKSKRQPSSSDDSDSSEDERRQRKENLKRKMKKMQNSKKMQKYSTSADEGSSSEVAENGRVGSGERRRGDRRTNTRRDSEDSVLSKGARPKSGTYRMKYEERGNEHRERKRRERSRGRRHRDSINEYSSDESQREEEDQGYKKGRRVAEKKQRDGSRESHSEENDKYRRNGEEQSYASKRGRRQGYVSPQDERRDRQSKDLNGRKDQRRDGYIKEKKRDRSRERGERHR
ncbi:uncharacterized protein [Apostichopus japonicus]|uniref:uncharacterized protein isoform X2 n=1 Tax=Stichopus japonicus TaxID=307972 RepID=UPI003AB4D0E0